MEWMLVNLAFKSTNTFLHAPWLQSVLIDAFNKGIDLKTLFEVTESNDEIMLKLATGLDGHKYLFHHTKKTPFMWCLRKEF
jgi:hypothetical protein